MTRRGPGSSIHPDFWLAHSSSSAPAARWVRRSPCWPAGPPNGRPRFDVIAVSRFSMPPTCLVGIAWRSHRKRRPARPGCIAQLPDAENVVFLVGLKFGTPSSGADLGREYSGAEQRDGALPASASSPYRREMFTRLRPCPAAVRSKGDPLTPVGEYANAAVARERIFEYFAHRHGTRLGSSASIMRWTCATVSSWTSPAKSGPPA